MLPAERHNRILESVRSARAVSTEELVRLLGASPETIRRDLVSLEEAGHLTRVHGGATLVGGLRGPEAPFSERSATATAGKSAIGRLAASLLHGGETVVIDVGTTALEVARAIPHDFSGTVATCSLPVAAELAGRPQLEVLLSGGRVRGGDLACSNAVAERFFADLCPDVAFLGSGGLDAATGLTDFYLDEVATRRTILRNAIRSYVLADASKLGRTAPHRVCGLGEVQNVITDAEPGGALRAALENSGSVVLAA